MAAKPDFIYLPKGSDATNAEFRFNPVSHRYALPLDGKWKAARGVTGTSGAIWTAQKQGGIKGWTSRSTVEFAFQHVTWENGNPHYKGQVLTPDTYDILLKDAKMHHKTLFERDGKTGTAVHAWAEVFWRDRPASVAQLEDLPRNQDPPDMSQPDWGQVRNATTALSSWADAHTIETIAVEKYVWSRRLWFCGTLDWVGMIDGTGPWLLDLKTSSRISYDHLIQCGGYITALNDMPNDPLCGRINNGMILRLDKKSAIPQTLDFSQRIPTCRRVFESALATMDELKELEEMVGE